MRSKPQPKPGKEDASYLEMRERIVARYPELSPQLQLIAQFALANPDRMALETAAQIAARLDAPASGIVRFAQALGYSGFLEMKRGFNDYLVYRAQAMDAPERKADGPAGHVMQSLSEARRSMNTLEHQFDADCFCRAVETLREARSLFVSAQHLSFPLASLFTWKLLEAGRQCVFLDNTGGFALPQSRLADKKDALLSISLSPYQPSVVEASKAHCEAGGPVVAVTDTPLSPLAPYAKHLLIVTGVRSASSGGLAGAITLVGALADAVMGHD